MAAVRRQRGPAAEPYGRGRLVVPFRHSGAGRNPGGPDNCQNHVEPLLEEHELDLVAKRGLFYLISLALILPGVVFLIIAPGLKPGIDFTGGSSLTVEFENDVEQSDLRTRLALEGHPDATVQNFGDRTFFIRTKELSDDVKASLLESLESDLSPDGLTELSSDLVSPW